LTVANGLATKTPHWTNEPLKANMTLMSILTNQISEHWDVIVVGAGHAGCEAALAAAKMGCHTLLLESGHKTVALMPCNPSVGGLAKSHLVYELDALGGTIGFVADATGIQFRTLNASRGPAVRATRSQNDKVAYATLMRSIINNTPNLTLLEGVEVTGIAVKAGTNDVLQGVTTAKHGLFNAKTVVVTAGTALNGTIHIGDQKWSGGGDGRLAAQQLSQSLKELGLDTFRLKTGTPPRLDPSSIDYMATEIQSGEARAPLFSWLGELLRQQKCSTWNNLQPIEEVFARLPASVVSIIRGALPQECSTWNIFTDSVMADAEQVPCWSTHTTPVVHQVIKENLLRSSLYGGSIIGTGVRYCPSIEDKIVKFSDKESHHVFLEPEGRACGSLIYPNGLSNSLPQEAQDAMVRAVPGLERARFVSYGYAIEYDCFNSLDLKHTLETKAVPGLYLAGQINGTTGYEEAAVLGFMAGVNAALKMILSQRGQMSRIVCLLHGRSVVCYSGKIMPASVYCRKRVISVWHRTSSLTRVPLFQML
jgi:tRNA uridine 5-carboxymethylaminomethyl modification enzyme